MADRPAAFSSHGSYILKDANWTGTSPINSTYPLSAYSAMRPDWRVKYDTNTVIITATIPIPRKADVVAMAGSNADPGDTIVRLTNNSGLSMPLDIPELPGDEIPLSPVKDLRDFNEVTRTADVWNWIASGNSKNLTVLALLWLGTLDSFTFEPGLKIEEEHLNDTQTNKAGTENIVEWQQRKRWVEFTVPGTGSERDKIIEWKRSGYGSARRSLLWPNTTINDCLLGSFPDQIGSEELAWGYAPVQTRFNEKVKGIPLL